MIERLYFLSPLWFSASPEYKTWRNYLGNSKMDTTTSLAEEKLGEHPNGLVFIEWLGVFKK
jgi:hypothetical protein